MSLASKIPPDAARHMASLCRAGARSGADLCGGRYVGISSTFCTPSSFAKHPARCRWPLWMGLNVPPRIAIFRMASPDWRFIILYHITFRVILED